MKAKLPKLKKTMPILMIGVLALLVACTDNEYDFNEVDLTIGIGEGDLSIPGGSTDTIKLDDVLDLEGTECVQIKENGDYVFYQEGGEVADVHPSIDKIIIKENTSTGTKVNFTLSSAGVNRHGKRKTNSENTITASGMIREFEYGGDKPEGVISLNNATTTADFTLNVIFSRSLSRLVNKLTDMSIKIPAYMTLSNLQVSSSYELRGNELILKDVPTGSELSIKCNITELDFDNPDKENLGKLIIKDNKISLDGNIYVKASFNLPEIGNITGVDMNDLYMNSNMEISNFTVTGATGRFSPAIDLQDLGKVEVGSVPDFLTDGNVVIDLYNPSITLSIYNDMEVSGFVSGTITAVKDGNETASVEIPELNIKPKSETPDGYTRICICRRASEVNAAEYDEVKEISNLSKLIRTIPDNISFTASARADDSKKTKIELGHEYTIRPQYNIEAPLTFDKDARIVYTDNIDGWNDDIKDLELADDSYITLSGTIENRVPAYLTLTAKPIGINQEPISSDDIEIEVSNTIVASADGENSQETPITVKLVQKKKGAMKKLDGLVITFEADATSPDGAGSVVGKTLNAKKHFIIARDIKIRLIGKVIGDLN